MPASSRSQPFQAQTWFLFHCSIWLVLMPCFFARPPQVSPSSIKCVAQVPSACLFGFGTEGSLPSEQQTRSSTWRVEQRFCLGLNFSNSSTGMAYLATKEAHPSPFTTCACLQVPSAFFARTCDSGRDPGEQHMLSPGLKVEHNCSFVLNSRKSPADMPHLRARSSQPSPSRTSMVSQLKLRPTG